MLAKFLRRYLGCRTRRTLALARERGRLLALGLPPDLLEPLEACAEVLARELPASTRAVYEQLLPAVAVRVGVLRAIIRTFGQSIPEPEAFE